MLWLFFLIIVALVVIKLVKLINFWNDQDIPRENFFASLYRNAWQYQTAITREVLDDLVEKYGKVFASYRGLKPSIFVSDVAMIKEITNKQFQNFFKRTFEVKTGDPLWDNLLTSLPYDQWKQMRTMMGHCFTSVKLKGIIPNFNTVGDRVIVKIKKIAESRDNEITLKKTFQGYGMDSVVSSAFGLDLQCTEDADSQFVKHAADLFNGTLATFVLIVFPDLLQYLPFVNFPPKETSKFFTKLGTHVIAEKRQKLDEAIKNGTTDIMDNILIAAREDTQAQVPDKVLASQAFVLFIAGVDTTVVSLEMVTYFMTIYPEVQEKVYKEIKEIMGDRTEVTYDDVQKMKYLDATIHESIRFYPITLILDRICTQDTTVNGVSIKKGTIVEMPVFAIHFDPENFPEPEKFQPERFLKENAQEGGLQGYLTFGDGPKNCIGKRLAIMNMQVLLAKLLLAVKLEKSVKTPPKLELKTGMNFTNVTKDPLVLKLTPR